MPVAKYAPMLEVILAKIRLFDPGYSGLATQRLHFDLMSRVSSLPFVLPFIRWAMVSRPHRADVLRPSRVRRIYDHELIYGLTGSQRLIVEGRSFPVMPHHLLLIRPGLSHCFHTETANHKSIGVHFDWTPQSDGHQVIAAGLQTDDTNPPHDELWRQPRRIDGWDWDELPYLDLTGRPRVRELLVEIVEVHSRGDELSRLHSGALLATAILQISHEAGLLRQNMPHLELGTDAARRVQRARELLESPRHARSSVAEIAAKVEWGSDYMRRMFRRILGTSPHRIQQVARLRQAKELLHGRRLPIGEISLRCGFDDPCYFSRCFKKEYGLTPSEFQRIH